MKEIYTYIQSQIDTNQFFSGAVIGGTILGLLNSLKKVPGIMLGFIWNKLFVTIKIDITDNLYKYTKEWISTLELKSLEKKFQLFTIETYNHEKKSYEYKSTLFPSSNIYLCKVNGKTLFIGSNRNEPSTTDAGILSTIVYETVTIRYFIWNTDMKYKILGIIENMRDAKKETGIQVYTLGSSGWEESFTIKHKSIDTVITDNNLDIIIADIDKFSKAENWYITNGIPYKRGYLLYGLPGTGKTSTVHAIASKYKRNVYFVSINSSFKDTTVIELLSTVKDNSIILFEDIDRYIDSDKNEFSIMPILSSMDGILARHNVLIFITTNDISKIDEALFRPGRIDVKLEYKYCSKHQVEKLYKLFYDTDEKVNEFINKVEEYKYSPAFIREYFIQNNTIEECINNWSNIISSYENKT